MNRVFTKGLGGWGSIPDRVIPKTQKRYLVPPCLAFSIVRYRSRVKWSNPGKEVAPSPTPRCSNYWKGSLLYYFFKQLQLLEVIQHKTSINKMKKKKKQFALDDSFLSISSLPKIKSLSDWSFYAMRSKILFIKFCK